MIDVKYFPPGMPDGWVFTIDEKTILSGLIMQSAGKRMEIVKKLLETIKSGINDNNRDVVGLKFKEIEKIIKQI
jgi:hypothetical protein